MKKLFFLFFLLLTGCSSTYNLEISGNSYTENIDINIDNQEEDTYFTKELKIPINKNSFLSGDPDPNSKIDENIKYYDYSKNNGVAKFSSVFNLSNFYLSSAIYTCYDKVNAYNQAGNTIISTSSRAVCFDNYPNLEKVTVNVNIDRKVKSHNADKVSENTYTWYLTPSNPKAINLVFESQINFSSSLKSSSFDIGSSSSSFSSGIVYNDNNFAKYLVYIIFALFVVILIASFIILKKVKESNRIY